MYWFDIQLAQRKGLKFYQTRSNAIILYDTLPTSCISTKIVMKTEGIIYQKVYVRHLHHHRKFPTKIIACVIWILMSLEAAKKTNESNQNPKPNYQGRRDPNVGKSPQRKSRNVPSLFTTILIKKNIMSQRLNEYGETRVWSRIHKVLLVNTYTC